MAIDGTVFDVPDSEENAAHFGHPKTHRTERCAFPQVRVVEPAECGTRAITSAPWGRGPCPNPCWSGRCPRLWARAISCSPTAAAEAQESAASGRSSATGTQTCCGGSQGRRGL
ncbi:hypothetical protein DIZ27_14120 [Streptomyces sp. NWU339]|nr:hypothetical protein DIZ27_14120 [Streptomyces sp. NWU339]